MVTCLSRVPATLLHTASRRVCMGGVSLGEARRSDPSELRLAQDSLRASSIRASHARACSGETPAEEREEAGLIGGSWLFVLCWEAR